MPKELKSDKLKKRIRAKEVCEMMMFDGMSGRTLVNAVAEKYGITLRMAYNYVNFAYDHMYELLESTKNRERARLLHKLHNIESLALRQHDLGNAVKAIDLSAKLMGLLNQPQTQININTEDNRKVIILPNNERLDSPNESTSTFNLPTPNSDGQA